MNRIIIPEEKTIIVMKAMRLIMRVLWMARAEISLISRIKIESLMGLILFINKSKSIPVTHASFLGITFDLQNQRSG